jgi:hypothetical protein
MIQGFLLLAANFAQVAGVASEAVLGPARMLDAPNRFVRVLNSRKNPRPRPACTGCDGSAKRRHSNSLQVRNPPVFVEAGQHLSGVERSANVLAVQMQLKLILLVEILPSLMVNYKENIPLAEQQVDHANQRRQAPAKRKNERKLGGDDFVTCVGVLDQKLDAIQQVTLVFVVEMFGHQPLNGLLVQLALGELPMSHACSLMEDLPFLKIPRLGHLYFLDVFEEVTIFASLHSADFRVAEVRNAVLVQLLYEGKEAAFPLGKTVRYGAKSVHWQCSKEKKTDWKNNPKYRPELSQTVAKHARKRW